MIHKTSQDPVSIITLTRKHQLFDDMSCKVISKKETPLVELELDVNLETSTLEDIASLNDDFYHCRALPLTLSSNSTDIKGELWFRIHNSLEFGVTLYNVVIMSAYFDLILEDRIYGVTQHVKQDIEPYNGICLTKVPATPKNQKLPLDTICSIWDEKILRPAEYYSARKKKSH